MKKRAKHRYLKVFQEFLPETLDLRRRKLVRAIKAALGEHLLHCEALNVTRTTHFPLTDVLLAELVVRSTLLRSPEATSVTVGMKKGNDEKDARRARQDVTRLQRCESDNPVKHKEAHFEGRNRHRGLLCEVSPNVRSNLLRESSSGEPSEAIIPLHSTVLGGRT